MKKKRVIAIIIVVIIASVAGYFDYQRQQQRANKPYEFSGTLEMETVNISFRVSGLIDNLSFKEGMRVKRDEVIAALDPVEYQYKVKVAKGDESRAKWTLAEVEAGNRQQDIEQANLQLKSAKSDYEKLLSDFERSSQLYKSNAIPQSQYEAAQNASNIAKFRVSEIEERLSLLKQGNRQESIEQAKAAYDTAVANRELAEKYLEFTILKSNVDGIILQDYKTEGEFVQAGATIFTIGEVDKMWLRTYLPVTESHTIKLGDEMIVKIDSLPDKAFKGRVSFISDEAEFTPKQIQTAIERVKLVYRMKIDIDNSENLLKQGMPASAYSFSDNKF